MNFKAQLQDYASFTDMKLDFYLPPLDNDQKSIYEAMRYSLLCGGKRIRPVLAYSTAALLGISKEDVAPFACAIEMIHTYSLIHDDLPAMDNDDYRRGQLTCHKKFGEAQAILAGDALLTKAFEIAGIGAIELANKMPEQAVRGALILRALAASAGSEGMVGGQVIDLEGEEKVLSKETHETLCALKTGALLTIPVQISVLYAGMMNTPVGDLLIKSSSLHGTTVSGDIIPTLIDELPIIAILAAYAKGRTVIADAAELKVKECNRIDAMVTNLGKMGVDITGTDDGMIIEGGKELHGAVLDTYMDHRIAMSFSIAALNATGTTTINDAEIVNVSYPGFYSDLKRLVE